MRAKKVKPTQSVGIQKSGNEAIGVAVTREFPDEDNFTGTVVAVRKMGCAHVYTVQYPDGDVEELDEQQYISAYALWLLESGGGA